MRFQTLEGTFSCGAVFGCCIACPDELINQASHVVEIRKFKVGNADKPTIPITLNCADGDMLAVAVMRPILHPMSRKFSPQQRTLESVHLRMPNGSTDCEFDFSTVCARSTNIAVFAQFPLSQCSTKTGHSYWSRRVGNDQLKRDRQCGHA